MSKYTAELRTILDNDIDIFDFEYTRLPESQAIISDDDLEQGFIDRYYFREVGFETVERFKHYLKVHWRENIEVFDKLLIAFNSEIDPISNMNSVIENKTVFEDTPKSKLGSTDYATNITSSRQSASGSSGTSQIELLEQYHDKIKDIITEFYDRFDELFMQLY